MLPFVKRPLNANAYRSDALQRFGMFKKARGVALSGKVEGIGKAAIERVLNAPHSHAVDPGDIIAGLVTTRSHGLSGKEASKRLGMYGPDRIVPPKPVSNAALPLRQFMTPVFALLVATAILSLVLCDVAEAVAIAVVLAINTAIGFVAEQRAVRSVEALRRLDVHLTRVRRDGTVSTASVEGVVPGDVVLVEAGDRVPADMRIVSSSALVADESTLTGEAVSVDKSADTVARDTPLHARTSMLYKGTAVTRCAAEAVVVGTGEATEVGLVAELMACADDDRSPLEKRLVRRQTIWDTSCHDFQERLALVG